MLALVCFVKYFRHYLYGRQFTIRTDHGLLQWLMNFKNPEGQVAGWLEFLSSFDMKIERQQGRSHRNADGVSRLPCKQCCQDDVEESEESRLHLTVNQLEHQATEGANLTLKEAYPQNKNIHTVIEWLEKGKKPKLQSVASESWFVKYFLNQWELLEVQDGLLVRRWKVLGTDKTIWQAIVPLCLRRKVLNYSHDIKASGHLGIRKHLVKSGRITIGQNFKKMFVRT